MAKMYGPEEKAKLERLITEGSNVLREVEDLQEGLKETVKAVAEELQVKPSIINKRSVSHTRIIGNRTKKSGTRSR